MISDKLQYKFQILEMAAFEQWQKSDPNKREKICRKLGEYEAKEIIKDIEDQLKKVSAAADDIYAIKKRDKNHEKSNKRR